MSDALDTHFGGKIQDLSQRSPYASRNRKPSTLRHSSVFMTSQKKPAELISLASSVVHLACFHLWKVHIRSSTDVLRIFSCVFHYTNCDLLTRDRKKKNHLKCL